MDGGETVFLYDFFGNQDGILKVIAVPGHERDTHVLPQRQLTQIHGGTIRQDVTAGNNVTLLDD